MARQFASVCFALLMSFAAAATALTMPADVRSSDAGSTGVTVQDAALYFWGTYSYSVGSGEALLKVDNIQNTRATTTSPLRIVLFLSKNAYPSSGTRTAIYNVGTIPANTTIHDVSSGQIPWTNPGAGCWVVTFVLEEQQGSTWTTVQHEPFANKWNIYGGCDPAPTISSVSPSHGPAAGGNSVTINGSNLLWTTSVKFGGVSATISSVTASAIEVTAPPHAAGPVTVALQTNSGSTSSSYTYDSGFSISGISPDHGPDAGGTNVTITGVNLSGATSVKFGGLGARINSNTSTSIRVTTPAHDAGTVQVEVSTPAGSGTTTFRYEPEPRVTKISPGHGPQAGGQNVTISGRNLAGATQVTFGGTKVVIVSNTEKTIVVTTAAHAPGEVNVVVKTSVGDDSTKYTYDAPDAPPPMQLLPVVGSLKGNFNSYFRTAMQLHNPTDAPLSGELVFHGAQTAAEATTSLPYALASGQTMHIPDILPALNTSGLGTLDLVPAQGTDTPLTLVRIFNDAADKGTAGMSIDFVPEEDVLRSGDSGVLIAPGSLEGFRFNIGARALESGATVAITIRTASGEIRSTPAKTFDPNSFGLSPASDIIGAFDANDSITFAVTAGACILYGSTTDNITQDPSYQTARRIPSPTSDAAVIPVVGSARGNFGSFFRTGLQLHNPLASPVGVRLVYHPAGQSAADGDPSMQVTLDPGQTLSYTDLLPAMNTAGVGSLDVVPLDGALPVIVSRIFNDAGAKGTAGMTLDAVRPADFLRGGDQSVLLAPADPANFRFNIGIRSMVEGASMQFTQRDSSGAIIRTSSRDVAPSYFVQVSASDLLGGPIGANDSITISMNGGAAVLYGAMTDNRTQDATTQVARRP